MTPGYGKLIIVVLLICTILHFKSQFTKGTHVVYFGVKSISLA